MSAAVCCSSRPATEAAVAGRSPEGARRGGVPTHRPESRLRGMSPNQARVLQWNVRSSTEVSGLPFQKQHPRPACTTEVARTVRSRVTPATGSNASEFAQGFRRSGTTTTHTEVWLAIAAPWASPAHGNRPQRGHVSVSRRPRATEVSKPSTNVPPELLPPRSASNRQAGQALGTHRRANAAQSTVSLPTAARKRWRARNPARRSRSAPTLLRGASPRTGDPFGQSTKWIRASPRTEVQGSTPVRSNRGCHRRSLRPSFTEVSYERRDITAPPAQVRRPAPARPDSSFKEPCRTCSTDCEQPMRAG